MSKNYPENWSLVKLEEITARIQNGLYKPPEFYGIGQPFIRMYNLEYGSWLLNFRKLALVEVDNDEQENFALKYGDIVINRVNSVELLGKTAWIGSQAVGYLFENMLVRLSLSDEVDHLFVAQQLNSFNLQGQILSAAKRAGGQASINSQDILQLQIPLPPLPEQRAIAAILSTWDEAITLTERLIAALRQRKQALMQMLLTGAVRFREFEGEEWETVEIGAVARFTDRSEPVDPEKEYRLVGVRWYVEGVHIHEIRQGSEIITQTLNRVQKGDILYNKMWVSKAAFGIARDEHDGAYGTSEYPTFTVDPMRLVVDFMGYLFHDPEFQYVAKSLCRGTTGRVRLHPNDFQKIGIQLPNVEEQTKITDTLLICDKEIDASVAYLESLKQLKRGLMQQLLTGAIRVPVDEA